MDLDGDGHRDVVSGSWPGEIYMFPGTKDGWAARVTLNDAAGKPLKRESASSVAVTDWDGDGDLDLICGFISGPVVFWPNESPKGSLAFGNPVELQAEGKKVEGHDGGPCIADWDCDGDDDLILGLGDGSVVLHRASRKEGEALPVLAAAVTLAPKGNRGDRTSSRAKPCVADWNADGKPDLLVGDFGTVKLPEPQLNDAQKARRDELRKEQEKLIDREMAAWEKMEKKARKKMGLEEDATFPQERAGEFEKILNEIMETDEDFLKTSEASQKIYEELASLEGGHRYAGNVWVYLRK